MNYFNYFTFIIIGLAGILLGKHWGRNHNSKKIEKRKLKTFDSLPKPKRNEIQEKAQEVLDGRTEDHKNKILQYIAREKKHRSELAGCNLEVPQQGITCDDIEKLLGVSDNTARKYLNELEEENKIKRTSDSERESVYRLI